MKTKIGLSGLTTEEFVAALRVKFLFPPPQSSAEKWFETVDPSKPIDSNNEFQVSADDADWPAGPSWFSPRCVCRCTTTCW